MSLLIQCLKDEREEDCFVSLGRLFHNKKIVSMIRKYHNHK